MLGSVSFAKDVLTFKPRFPLTKGVTYRVTFHPTALLGSNDKPAEVVVSIPKPEVKPTSVVTRIYPTSDKLPDNHLRFYLHFSAPMSQGESYSHIKLLDAKGNEIKFPFLDLDQELWDPTGTRFTLFLHPGRVKRGLKPREDEGPVLEEGKRYTLVIDRAWKDADGNPMKATYKKAFSVGALDETQPDVKTWKLAAPSANSRAALTVTFPKPMDHGLATRLLWVIDKEGKKVAGKVEMSDRETRWLFTPERAWEAGAYHLVADTRVEDPMGNSVDRPFEVDVLRPVEREIKVDTVKVPFAVKK
jgi:hypothetical protein